MVVGITESVGGGTAVDEDATGCAFGRDRAMRIEVRRVQSRLRENLKVVNKRVQACCS